MNPLGYICILIGTIAIAAIWLTVKNIRQRKILISCICGFQVLFILSLFVIAVLLFSNLNTYSRLTAEQDVADVLVRSVVGKQFEVELVSDSGQSKRFLINGDEWQIDVRIIKWKSWANLLGLDSYYQLDRLSGRYKDIELTNVSEAIAHKISSEPARLSLWQLRRLTGNRLALLDAYFGQSVFMPMRHLARYRLSVTQAGLIARPSNEIASQALQAW
ncbi:MAG: hypothetical protein ACI9KM_003018 [Rubritalea sp.]|jgi:hypothetical protein